jgi:hypothetical protein
VGAFRRGGVSGLFARGRVPVRPSRSNQRDRGERGGPADSGSPPGQRNRADGRGGAWVVGLTALLGAAAGCVLAGVQGPDAGWDVANYHLYNGWAFLAGRDVTRFSAQAGDIGAAQLQTWFHPGLDALLVALWRAAGAGGAAMLVGAWQGLVAGPVAVLAWAAGAGPIWAVLLGLAGLGPIFWGTVGTFAHDTTLAPVVAAGVACGLSGRTSGRGAIARLCGSLVIIGAACGLRPTALPYAAIPLWAALAGWVAAGGAHTEPGEATPVSPQSGAPYGASWARWAPLAGGGLMALAAFGAGWLVTGGFWAAKLVAVSGQPLFPIGSDMLGSNGLLPPFHYRFTVPMDAAPWPFPFWPLSLSVGAAWFGEPVGRDARTLVFFAVSLVIAVWGVAAGIVHLRGRSKGRMAEAIAGQGLQLIQRAAAPRFRLVVGLVATFALWALLLGVPRYLATFEALVPVAIFTLLRSVVASRQKAALVALGLIAATWPMAAPQPSQHGPHDLPVAGLATVVGPERFEQAVILLSGSGPLAFVAPSFPASTRFVRWTGNLHTDFRPLDTVDLAHPTGVMAAARAAVHAAPADRRFMLYEGGAADEQRVVLDENFMGFKRGRCEKLATRLRGALMLCELLAANSPEQLGSPAGPVPDRQ